jgi:diguanylate cyclase (GGDEF)-like protein
MISQLQEYISNHEDWLMERILYYARQREYTKYTSTLKEAWRLSIAGLSKSLIELLNTRGRDIELGPHEKYVSDPASHFGIIEANKHRKRGIRLDMFLGLMKYYHQSYCDLIHKSNFQDDIKLQYVQLITRFFDRIEIGFCTQWASAGKQDIVQELQFSNREMTNEKNKYLTIFESLSMPVFIVARDGTIENMNYAASGMLNDATVPGRQYYGKDDTNELFFTKAFPWLKNAFNNFMAGTEKQKIFETGIKDNTIFFYISFSRSLDISGKFLNTIVILEDITKRKTLEKELEKLATTDPLTGAKNRRSFLNLLKAELNRAKRYNHSLALYMMDIDHFKKINDKFGHDIGDKLLKLLVAKSYSVLRDSDLFGRWGGEEFIILVPETDFGQASFVAERLRGELAKSKLEINNGTIIHFTVSIGFSLNKNPSITSDELIKNADNALYTAKRQGRNQVVFCDH